MSADYIILASIAILAIGGGVLLLHKARAYRANKKGMNLPKG